MIYSTSAYIRTRARPYARRASQGVAAAYGLAYARTYVRRTRRFVPYASTDGAGVRRGARGTASACPSRQTVMKLGLLPDAVYRAVCLDDNVDGAG